MIILSISAKLESAFHQAVDQLVSIGIAFLYVLVVMAVARLTVRVTRRIFWKRLAPKGTSPEAATLINHAIGILVYFAAITLLLALWGASWATLLTAISISTLAIVLGFQDLLKSLLGGVFVILDQPYSLGDRISIAGIEGEVTDVGLRSTIVRSHEGHQISIPNSTVLTSPLQNIDRTVISETLIRLTRIQGDMESTRTRIESVLAVEPEVESTVTVEFDEPVTIREILKKSGIPIRTKARQEGRLKPLRVEIAMPVGDITHSTEREALDRISPLYPDANITVRRGARRE